MPNDTVKILIGESPYPGNRGYEKTSAPTGSIYEKYGFDHVAFVPKLKNKTEGTFKEYTEKNKTFRRIMRLLYGKKLKSWPKHWMVGGNSDESEKLDPVTIVEKLTADKIYLFNILGNTSPQSSQVSNILKFINNQEGDKKCLLIGAKAIKQKANLGNASYYTVIHPAARRKYAKIAKQQWDTFSYRKNSKYSNSKVVGDIFIYS
ncbi:hypothetical protein NHG32_07260 [Aerococcaceae bacterium NML191219]|nr:hypothetical protein [Aerococcaceae bacterium NML191219]MDO4775507.1 hypothetical protein [Aerococcaceae bacterium]